MTQKSLLQQQRRELQRQRRLDSIDHDVEVQGRHKTERVDLGLTLLHRRALPGVPLTRDDIAVWAGCSDANIVLIERKALHKVRRRLEQLFPGLDALDILQSARSPAKPARRHRQP